MLLQYKHISIRSVSKDRLSDGRNRYFSKTKSNKDGADLCDSTSNRDTLDYNHLLKQCFRSIYPPVFSIKHLTIQLNNCY